MQNIWKHLKKAYLGFRRGVKGSLEHYKSKRKQQEIEELAKSLWEHRWILLKKPCHLTEDEKRKIKELEKMDQEGFIGCCLDLM